MKYIPIIPKPTTQEVNYYLKRWDSLKNYTQQESSLRTLFSVTYPKNTNLDHVLIKVAALNDFYSTHVTFRSQFAEHIIRLNIDDRLHHGEISLVNELAKITWENGKNQTLISFASKYCNHHFPNKYVIYDYFVERVLTHFRDQDHFYEFRNGSLKDYRTLHKTIQIFIEIYQLTEFGLKDIDRYLWLLGKEHFPRNYSKGKKTVEET